MSGISEINQATKISDMSGNVLGCVTQQVQMSMNGALSIYNEKSYMNKFFQEMGQVCGEIIKKEVMIGFLGEMSSGKSTLINMITGYPLLPVAAVTTSVCPVVFCYGEEFKLQVFTYQQDGDTLGEKIRYSYDGSAVFTEKQKNALNKYVISCFKNKIIICENLEYYYDSEEIKSGTFSVDWQDSVKAAQMLIMPLTTYIGQDSANRSEASDALVAMRNDMLRDIFGLSPDESYGIRIYLNSELLKNGLTLVDLPGLGSDVGTHSNITIDYLKRADCCVLAFGVNGKVNEQNSALNTLMEFEGMKSAGKDSRFLVVINKCDQLKEGQGKSYSDILASAVAQIKPKVTKIKISDIIPISAMYGEIRLIKNGIEIEHTRFWKKNEEDFSDDFYTKDQILKKMDRNYQFSFRYEDPITGKNIECSTAKFMEEMIGEYGARVRMLNALRQVKRLADTYGIAVNDLRVQASMIELLKVCGDDLMKNLLSQMEDALEKAKNDFVSELDRTKEEIEAEQVKLRGKVEDARKEYVKGLKQADKDINTHMDTEVSKMEGDFYGHHFIDELDDRGKKNTRIYDELEKYFQKFSFTQYLNTGRLKINASLEEQRFLYQEDKDKIKQCFKNLIADCDESLSDAYRKFAENENVKRLSPSTQEIYKRCYENAKNSIKKYLIALQDQMNREIDKNSRIEDEIDKTLQELLKFELALEKEYHDIVLKYFKGQKGVSFWNTRPFLKVNEIKRVINLPFTSTETKTSQADKIKNILIENRSTSLCHVRRMNDAIEETNEFFSKECIRKVDIFFPTISDSVKNLFGNAETGIVKEYLTMRQIAQEIKSILTGFNNLGYIVETIQFAKEEIWARCDAEETEKTIISVLEDANIFIKSVEEKMNSVTV